MSSCLFHQLSQQLIQDGVDPHFHLEALDFQHQQQRRAAAAELDADEAEQRRQLTQAVDEDHTNALGTVHRDLTKEVRGGMMWLWMYVGMYVCSVYWLAIIRTHFLTDFVCVPWCVYNLWNTLDYLCSQGFGWRNVWFIVQMEGATPEKDRLAAQRLMDQYRRDLESQNHDLESQKNRQLSDLQVKIFLLLLSDLYDNLNLKSSC